MPQLSPATIAQITSRGYTQGNLQSWLKDNPDIFEAGDAEHVAAAAQGGWQQANARALASFPNQNKPAAAPVQGLAAAAPSSTSGGSGGSSGGGGGGAAPASTPLTPITPTTPSAGAAGSGIQLPPPEPTGFMDSGFGGLRPLLSTRTPPQQSNALTGLQKLY